MWFGKPSGTSECIIDIGNHCVNVILTKITGREYVMNFNKCKTFVVHCLSCLYNHLISDIPKDAPKDSLSEHETE